MYAVPELKAQGPEHGPPWVWLAFVRLAEVETAVMPKGHLEGELSDRGERLPALAPEAARAGSVRRTSFTCVKERWDVADEWERRCRHDPRELRRLLTSLHEVELVQDEPSGELLCPLWQEG